MNQSTKPKSILTRIAALLAAIILAVGAFASLQIFAPNAFNANANQDTRAFIDFAPRALGIENPRFVNASGRTPSSPTGWTETSFVNMDRGATVMGVLDLAEYTANQDIIDEVRLYQLPQYALTPPRALPNSMLADGHNRFLMINTTEDTQTAIGFNSSSLTLNPNGFYRISAWAKTGDFDSQHGASVRLNGISDHNIAFSNIRTVPVANRAAHNMFGWQQFTFYVRTGPIATETVNLTLAVGDYYRGLNVPARFNTEAYPDASRDVSFSQTARGYAFFDNIEAYQISPTTFYDTLNVLAPNHDFGVNPIFNQFNPTLNSDPNNRIQIIDLSLPLVDPGVNLDLGEVEYNLNNNIPSNLDYIYDYWRLVAARGAGNHSALVRPFTLDTTAPFNEDTCRFNLSNRVISPQGVTESINASMPTSSDVFVLSTFDYSRRGRGDNAHYHPTAIGIRSPRFTISQMQHYRLSVWVNDNNIVGGAGATLVVTTDILDVNAQPDPIDPDRYQSFISFTATHQIGDATNEARHGWRQVAFYIRGSFHGDYQIDLGLWLGQEGQLSSGTALFSNIRLEQLTATEFNQNVGASIGGAPVDIDVPQTGASNIVNGDFLLFETPTTPLTTQDTPRFPLEPSNWAFNTPRTVNRVMFSQDESLFRDYLDVTNHYRYVVAGIMPTSQEHFLTYRHLYGAGARRPIVDSASVLYMASSRPVAFNFTSPEFAVEESATARISVRMMVENVPVGDYGASLVLLDSNGIISTIQNITNTNGAFQEFAFYISNDDMGRNFTLEIWLGLNERATFNTTRLSRGNVYVDSVNVLPVDAATFNARHAAHLNSLNHGAGSTHRMFAAFDYNGFGFNEFDAYDTNFVRFPYSWSVSGPTGAPMAGVRSGIFNSANMQTVFDANGNDTNYFGGGIPSTFRNADAIRDGRLYRNNVVMLENINRTASRLSFDRPIRLTEDSHYRVEVSIKVDVPYMFDGIANGAGAGVAINNDFYFTNLSSSTRTIAGQSVLVRDTATLVDNYLDNNAFKTFTFLIYTGDSPRNLNLTLMLGGETPNQFTAGRIYLNHIAVSPITNVEFNDTAATIHRDSINIQKAVLGLAPVPGLPDDDGALPDHERGGFEVFLIPAILFSVLLLLVLIIVAGKRIMARRAAKVASGQAKSRRTARVARYDRNTKQPTSYRDFGAGAIDADSVTDEEENEVFESFDDPIEPKAAATPKRSVKAEATPVAPVAATSSEPKAEPAATEPKADEFVDSFDD